MPQNPHYTPERFEKLSKAVMDLDKDYDDAKRCYCGCKVCEEKYTVEERNKEWVIYFGRCKHRHGFNLGYLKDVDIQKVKELIKLANKQLKNK